MFYVRKKWHLFILPGGNLSRRDPDKFFGITLQTVNSNPNVGCYANLLVGIDDTFYTTLDFFDDKIV